MPSIIVFPGQGSQFVGMGKKLLHLPKVARMFELANHVFKCDILNLCLNGPQTELDKTQMCQPAVFVTSMAAVEYLKVVEPLAIDECYATAGFSVGEYAALVLCGSITFEDGELIKIRSDAMKKACEMQESGLMTAFVSSKSKLSLSCFAAKKWCIEKLNMPDPVVCEIANYLNHQCKVIGGNKQALDFIEMNYREFGINRVKRLPVSGAFHTRLMESCEEPLNKALKTILVKRPSIKFYSNSTAELAMTEDKIKQNLVKQISLPVKWEQILNQFYFNANLPVNNTEFKKNLEEQSERDKEKHKKKVDNEVVKDFLNASSDNETENEIDIEIKKEKMKHKMKTLQDNSREYPDIYECGPGSVTGPVLKIVNSKAHRFYKHIGV